MRIAISGNEGFIGPYLIDMLGKDAIEVPDEAISDARMLDGLLAGVGTLVHFNGHPPGVDLDRNDPKVPDLMREWARAITDAKNRHHGLHLILIGSLRVHSEADHDGFSGTSTLSPRDATAEGQLWMEERAMEHGSDDSPVSILRLGNVHGIPLDGGKGRGYLHSFAGEALSGWIGVPGDGTGMKDIIHVRDLCNIIAAIAEDPPPTREALAVGNGWAYPISELAGTVAQELGAEVQLWANESDEVWGVVDARYLEQRLEYEPMVKIEEVMSEALANASF